MKTLGMVCAAWLVMMAVAAAQMEPLKPAPELKKLDMFAGSWTLDGDMKASPMGPGGKILETETCEWMQGNFYLVCHTDFKGSMGSGTGLSIMGYSSDDKVYSYREFNSWGEFDDSKGTLDGDTFSWTNETKMGGMTMKGRFVMKNLTPMAYNFSYEMSQDGAKWTTVMDGKATKAK